MQPKAPATSITDVTGVFVGQVTRDEPGWLTGVTVVRPPPGTVGGVDVRGGGPGTRETDLLDPRHAVDFVDAVVLAGGSAYGLAAADGVMQALGDEDRGWPVGGPGEVVPIVPAAILFDLGRAGTWRHHPTAADGRRACRAAGPLRPGLDEGSIGAGTGASAGGLRGGVGTASTTLPDGSVVGALVVVNAIGSALGPDGRLLAEPLLTSEERALLPDPDEEALTRWRSQHQPPQPRAGTATTLAVVATDATLDKAGCATLARVAHDGYARALSPVHTAFDGDTVFALATGARPAPAPVDLVALQTAAADAVSRSIARAMLCARSVDRSAVGGARLPSYRSLCR